MRSRALLLALLVPAAALAGCAWSVEERAPVVLVEQSFEAEGEGPLKVFDARCDMARYDPAEGRVVLFHPPQSRMRHADFIVLQPPHESWRAVAGPGAPDGFPTVAVAAGSGGGGPLSWLDAGGGASTLGFGPTLVDARGEVPRTIRWDGERAEWDGTPLEKGVPVERSFSYDVPRAEGGGVVRVTETIRATYLGALPVELRPWTCEAP